MSLSRFAVACPFLAWSPSDRDYPERRISITPSPRNLFTDQNEPSGAFIKFLQNGEWFEADREEFERSTIPMREHHQSAQLTGPRGA